MPTTSRCGLDPRAGGMLLASALLLGCSPQADGNAAAATDVNREVPRVAPMADTPVAVPAMPTPEASPTPVATATTSAASLPEGPIDPGSAQGAGDVVQRYFALIEARRYRAAWQLWDDGGKASGMSAADFAAEYARYDEYHAEVGAPTDEDAGAGQRYITVPVRIHATLKRGGDVELGGRVVLHRVADGIESDDPSAHSWRIRSAGIKPRPIARIATDPMPVIETRQ